MANLIEFQISVQDDQTTDDTLIDLLAHLAMDLERQNAVVTPAQCPQTGRFSKEDRSSSLLNIGIDRDDWSTCSQWLYERLMGTTTKVKFDHGDFEFAFQERDHQDQQPAHQEFEVLVNWMETSRRVLHA